mmetsp:Transcript_4285/g.7227  ORF Transcript_4285/g.7227 Transcript_4285/m.7227 type:complete len:232 (-) Transcript_4285:266-961(-)
MPCVRTVHSSLNLARQPASRPLLSSMAAPPTRKSVFCSSMFFSLPWYRFCVRFSVETTRQVALRLEAMRRLARSMLITPAEQPMPDRLYVRQEARRPNLWTTMEHRLGVGENKEQLMTRKSIFLGSHFVLRKTSSTAPKMTVSLSARAASTLRSATLEGSLRLRMIPGGQAVAWPVALRARMRSMNLSESSEKQRWARMICTSSSWFTFQSSGGSKQAKSTRYTFCPRRAR